MRFSAREIAEWKSIQLYYKELAYTDGLLAAADVINDGVSDDGFIDFRAWLISKGKEVYMNAIKNPDSLVDLDVEKGKAYFESHSYIADFAYPRRAILENVGTDKIYNIMMDAVTQTAKGNIKYIIENADFNDRSSISEIENLLTKGLFEYIKGIYDEYEVYDAIDNNPLSREQMDAIKSEIEFAPPVEPGKNELDLIVPSLYEKYNNTESEDEVMALC